MEYLDNKSRKIDNTAALQLEKLQADGELTKVPQKAKMSSFKLYNPKAASQAAKVEKEIKLPVKKRFTLGRVSLTEKMMFMDNLSTMLKAGLALSPALATLRREIKNKYFANVVDYLHRYVENGQVLSKGMAAYPNVFSEMVIATVEVGENTGMLADSFGHLADILRAQHKLRSKVVSALMYPVIVLLALIGVSLFLALSIFPQLIDLFEAAGVNLPFVLLAVQSVSFFLTNYSFYAVGILILLVIIWKIIFHFPKPKLALHSFYLKIPFAGRLIQEISLASFSSSLQALLAAGLAIVQSMKIVAKTLGNTRYRTEILKMSEELEKGVPLSKSMAHRPTLFPSLTIQLCQVGESTGELENILRKISKFYEDRVNNILSNLSTIIEPVLLVVVGVAVGFIALSVIGPMYELTSSFAP
ncbi:MAG: type II secretion system F family protein [Patescibacteria group bacterium]|nr:type II secretion system F family protein [Patescibacteria group bacterium]